MSLSVLAAFIDATNFPVLSEAALTATKNIGGVGGVIIFTVADDHYAKRQSTIFGGG